MTALTKAGPEALIMVRLSETDETTVQLACTAKSPDPERITFRRDDFVSFCRLCGAKPERVLLVPSEWKDYWYPELDRALLSPAKLYALSRQERPATLKEDADSARERLVRSIARLKDNEEAKRQIREGRRRNPAFGKEFDRILAHPLIRGLEVDGKKAVHVLTEEIRIEFDRRSYLIGEFKIVIPTRICDGGSSPYGVRMFNLTRARDRGYRHHPHVDSGGYPCLGNIMNDVKSLIRKKRYEELAALLVAYLQAHNPKSTYSDIGYWR